MSIERFFTDTFTVRRLEYTDNIGTMTTQGTFEGHIQQFTGASTGMDTFGAFMWTKSFTVWCPLDTDVQEGDSIVDSNGVTYSVRTRKVLNLGGNQHVQIQVERDENVDPISV